jgi:hypothetical protein
MLDVRQALAPAAGGQFFTLMFGGLFDRHLNHAATTCTGHECYRSVFLITAPASVLALLLTTTILWRQHTRQPTSSNTPPPLPPPSIRTEHV